MTHTSGMTDRLPDLTTLENSAKLDSKIIMYYDDTCSICRTEAYHMRDEHGDKIHIVTIDEGISELEKAGISRVDAMTYLCVQESAEKGGAMIKGIKAVTLLHLTAGTKMGKVLTLPVAKQVASVIYPIFAKYRYYMPNWFTKMMFGKVANKTNNKANKLEGHGVDNHKTENHKTDNHKPDNCESGTCHIPPSKRI